MTRRKNSKSRGIKVVLWVSILCGLGLCIIKYGHYFNIYLGPPTPQKYVQIALNKMDNGIYASGTAWEEVRAEVIASSKEFKAYEDTYDLLNEALQVAGGKHSSLFTTDAINVVTAEQEMPTLSMDEQGILYVKVPGYMGTDGVQQYADTVIEYVTEKQGQIEGVIIDLRDNTGGNLGPMLAAVSPFLPDGKVLSFRIKGKDQPVMLWEGTVTGGGSNVTVAPIKISEVPVAILQNEWTASSGEAVLLAFRGLDYGKSFGKPSAGYCSCNTVYYLYDGAMLQLTVGSDVARTGEVFCEEPITPDVETDTPMEAAREWILNR